MSVLWRGGPSDRAEQRKTMLLGDPQHPNVVFGYRQSDGIVFILRDPTGQSNLVQEARAGRLQADLDDEIANRKQRRLLAYLNELETFDALAKCS